MKFILYKFFENEEYRDTFLKGILYSNKLSVLRGQENKVTGVNDSFENADTIALSDENHFVQGPLVQKNNRLYMCNVEFAEKPKDYREGQGFVSYNQNDYNIFCLSAIILDENGKVVKFDKRNRGNFGKYGVIIKYPAEFILRIENQIDYDKNVKCIWGNFVTYIDFDKRKNIQKWSPFMKFSSFSSQQEYRLVFDADVDNGSQLRSTSSEDTTSSHFSTICISSRKMYAVPLIFLQAEIM